MRLRLLDLLDRTGGIVTRTQVLAVVPKHVLDDALRAGFVVRLLPGVYAAGGVELDRTLRQRAALAYRPDAALSCVDALSVWGHWPGDRLADEPVHVNVGPGPAVHQPGITVHRVGDMQRLRLFEAGPHRLRVVSRERALVDSWALLPPYDRRGPTITALRERWTRPELLVAAVDERPRVAGAASLRDLVALVAAGCHSELELWGHAKVFRDPRLSHGVAQFPASVNGRRFYLDRYFEAEMVDVELDGAAFHGSRTARERDIRRDAALAAIGILVVRLSHRRLHEEPRRVADELADILAARRRQLRIA